MNNRILILFFFMCPAFLLAQSYKSHVLSKAKLSIQLSDGVLTLMPLTSKAIRVQWEKELPKEQREFVIINTPATPVVKLAETSQLLTFTTDAVTVVFNKQTLAIQFADKSGKVFLCEKAGGRKLDASTVMGQACYVAEQSFDSPDNESLFGLGQFQDGHFNLRNIARKLTQVNSQIAIPFLYSSKGYGILWHQYGLTEFNPADNLVALNKQDTTGGEKGDIEVTTTSGTQRVSRQQAVYKGSFSVEKDGEYSLMLDMGNMESRHLLVIDGKACIDQSNQWLPPAASALIALKAGTHSVQVICKASNTPRLTWKMTVSETVFRSVNAKSLDYVVFYGKDADEVIGNYRNLSGTVPMLPLWAYGFWQCRERYTSDKHLVQTIEEFRKRKLPVDVIVQDWQYWGKYGWGVPKFDEANYPNPELFIKKLHDLHARFSVSVWENLDKKSEVAKDYVSKNLYINNSPWIDIYNPETQKTHWNALNENLFSKGVDSWWMDATEPENDALVGKQTFFGPGHFYRLTYPLFVSQAVYEGQRATNPNKRVVTLTRSAFAGQQRFGTINWSGDIGWDWDTYKRQIVAGLNFSMTGMPFWTTDIGGFFRPGRTQYTDKKYHDILTRWFQWSTFNTIFRMHGYQTETEPWKYGDTVENNMRKMMNIRYQLLPYIYSEAWQVSSKGSTIARPLVMDFKDDTEAVKQPYEYMFGKSLLVAPVTEAGITQAAVYLPKAAGWFNFWTGQAYTGGQTIQAAAPQDQIPVFVKAGSILPMGKTMQYTGELLADTLDIKVYSGANGSFELYEDEGDNYNYEKGRYSTIKFIWNNTANTLLIAQRKGSFASMLKSRVFRVSLIAGNKKIPSARLVKYDGRKVIVKL
jgi:alpha-D-xyloside xylohydrolase